VGTGDAAARRCWPRLGVIAGLIRWSTRADVASPFASRARLHDNPRDRRASAPPGREIGEPSSATASSFAAQ
jgi:hypothetical protein